MTFGEKLKQIRIDKGMSQGLLALRTGLSLSSIQKYEYDEVIPSLDACKIIANQLRCSLEELLEQTNPPVTNEDCRNIIWHMQKRQTTPAVNYNFIKDAIHAVDDYLATAESIIDIDGNHRSTKYGHTISKIQTGYCGSPFVNIEVYIHTESHNNVHTLTCADLSYFTYKNNHLHCTNQD